RSWVARDGGQKFNLPKPKLLVISKSLPAKGTLVMDVNIGEVRVVRSDEEKLIRLENGSGAFYDEATVRSWVRQFAVAGDRASIDLRLPKHNDNHSSP